VNLVFRTKPQLAAEMVESAARSGKPFRWVAGDAVYGSSPTVARLLRALEKWYVLDGTSEARVWTARPEMRPAGTSTPKGGRLTKSPMPQTKPRRVGDLGAEIPADAWTRRSIAEGSQGPRVYEYAELAVWFSEEGSPTAESKRLLFKRGTEQDAEIKYQRSNAPTKTPLHKLAEIGGQRWCVERDFQCGKGQCGLDEYETRGWIGWHHHTALSMLALWFLGLQKERLGEKTSADFGAGTPHGAAVIVRRASLGQADDPAAVEPAATPQRDRGAMPRPRKTTARPTTLAK